MARDLTASMESAVIADVVRPILIAEIQTASGYVRVWNGVGDLSWNSQTWQGVGTFGGVSPVQETTELQATGVNFQLSGIPSALISTALADIRWGRSATLWIGAFNTSTGALIADPYQIFSGLTDVPAIEEGADTATISISAESRLIDLDRPRVRRYTHEDQQLVDATDLGFEYVPYFQAAEVTWGRS